MTDITKEEPNIFAISFEGRLAVSTIQTDNMHAIKDAPVAPNNVGRAQFRIFLLCSSFDSACEHIGQLFV
jgi:hypothetical protein